MHVAICGPATLDVIEPGLSSRLNSNGYPFPMIGHLALAFRQRGHTVTLVTSATDVTNPVQAAAAGINVRIVPSRPRAKRRAVDFFARERRLIERELRDANPDVVHAHWTYEFALAALSSNYPALVTVHDWAPAILWQSRDFYRAMRSIMQAAVLMQRVTLTAPSEYLAEKVAKVYGHSCPVVPNAVPMPGEITHRSRACSGGRSMEGLRVGMMNAADGPRKNVKTALKAWSIVRAQLPEARLICAGGPFGPDGRTAEWARSAGLADGVEFIGHVPPSNIFAWYAALDVFLHPSREESFGNVLVEAMASGVPVIAGAESGAVPEVVGKAGVLVDTGSASAISEAVLALAADEPRMGELSDMGRLRARIFEVETVADRYLAHLEGLLC